LLLNAGDYDPARTNPEILDGTQAVAAADSGTDALIAKNFPWFSE
jgi:hypothetical protein